MIQINELRIGNIVQVVNPEYHPKLLNVPLVVGGISPALTPLDCKPTFSISLENLNQEPNTFYENCSQFIKYVFPIPLTEEILLKCGGKKANSEKRHIEHDRFLLRWLEAYKYWYVTDIETGAYITKVEFVHEWQNVFWSLNGQELTVQL
jgi:hypothetical protein